MTIPAEFPAEMTGLGYASRRITKAPNWHTLVALDLLFNNMATGLFLVAAAVDLAAPGAFGASARLAYPLALLLLMTDLLCLVLDLGHRLRFHHMLRVFKPTSPMSLGTWCLALYSLPLAAISAIEASRLLGFGAANGPVASGLRLMCILAAIPFAFGSAAYKGVLFSTSSQPGWKDARWLGGYLTNSAIAIGCAELLAIATLLSQGAAATALRASMVILLALNIGFLARVIVELRPALRAASGGDRLVAALVLGAVTGVGLPSLLASLGPMFPGRIVVVDLAALATMISGSFLVRWAIVMLPHHGPGSAPAAYRDGGP